MIKNRILFLGLILLAQGASAFPDQLPSVTSLQAKVLNINPDQLLNAQRIQLELSCAKTIEDKMIRAVEPFLEGKDPLKETETGRLSKLNLAAQVYSKVLSEIFKHDGSFAEEILDRKKETIQLMLSNVSENMKCQNWLSAESANAAAILEKIETIDTKGTKFNSSEIKLVKTFFNRLTE